MQGSCKAHGSDVEEGANQWEASHNERPLLGEPMKPCQRSRDIVKESLLKLRSCLSAVCGMEWYCYATLGVLTAILSFTMDLGVTKLLRGEHTYTLHTDHYHYYYYNYFLLLCLCWLSAHQWLYTKLEGHSLLQFCCWTLYPACLCAVAASFCDNVCPASTGSGIPEVRTMLAGIELPHYLTLTNMFTKFLGLTCTLAAGSTVFLGKVGPFVHISTMAAAYLSKLCTLIQADNKERADGQMLVVAAAVGVASCFGAPISGERASCLLFPLPLGVLFSVEVMSSHFALRHYLPCFFSAACGALTFRLFSVWSGDAETLQALFKTYYPGTLPFYPLEVLLFALLGYLANRLLCGAVSCCFLCCHRRMLSYAKANRGLVRMLTTEKAVYSGVVAFALAAVTFPESIGSYMASQHTMRQLLTSLLESRQWSSPPQNASVHSSLEWSSSGGPALLSLLIFLLMKMWMLILACTLPLPAGYFMPVFIYGGALGRLLGEGAACVCPSGRWCSSINPGGYALAGAAAFSGAATHTLSPALLAVELTGQFSHAAPVLLATLLANAVARAGRRPSFYDAVAISKKLPHLPSLKKERPQLTDTPVGQLLRGKPLQLRKTAGVAEVQRAVNASLDAEIPLVDSHESQTPLGFALRSDLLKFLRGGETEVPGAVRQTLDEVCRIHPPSVLLSPSATVQQAYRVLTVVGSQPLFVVDQGKLLGFITWREMKRMMEDLAKEV
ncbi:chloride channel K [Nelusetta ayraudi]|uniref:chloride channel K n=1 Tax=Nelusetta ayraudi TaxID=303726 RepID=UPI003F6FF389